MDGGAKSRDGVNRRRGDDRSEMTAERLSC